MVFPIRETASSRIETTAKSSLSLSSADNEARQALARAEALRANWTEASLRDAIELYDRAALLWISISEFAKASEAKLKSGDVHFLFSEYKQALEQYQDGETLAKKAGDRPAQATALSQIGLVQSYLGNNALAEKQITKALQLFEQHEATRNIPAYGEALSNLAEVNYAKGQLVKALSQLETALKFLQNDRRGQARVHLFNGYIAGSRGDPQKALAEIDQALKLYREINDMGGEALALTAMGLSHSSNRDEIPAIETHKKAGEIFRAIGLRYSEGIALNAIGQANENLNEYSIALFYYQRALAIFESIGALDAASGTTCGIGSAQYRSENLDQALASYERCLMSSRAAGKRRIEAFARTGIAMVYGAQGRHELALKQYRNLQMFFKSIDDLRGQAMAWNGQGTSLLQIGEKQKALEIFRQAFFLSEKIGDKGLLISTLYNLALANEALGFHDVALSRIEQSFALIKEVRENVGSPDFRASYFSAVSEHYDLCIEILMQLEQVRPGEGFVAKALFVSEQARARLLIDLLSESRVNIREGAATELLERERKLRKLLQSQAEYQMNLSLSGKDSPEIAEVGARIAELRSDYQAIQAQLREQNPRLFAFERFEPVGLKRIQKELDDNTMLLEYALGDVHSYLWVVTSNSIHSYELPNRKTIEDAAHEFTKLITARQASDGQNDDDYKVVETADSLSHEKAIDLSRMLLGPVAEQRGNQRLVIVGEGALQYLPFDALLAPSEQVAGPTGPSKRLIETNEVVVLPSASTLIAIRGAQNDKDSAVGKLVAIIADPVLGPSDDRVQNESRSPAIAKAAADQGPDQSSHHRIENFRLARLAHASEEADAISAVAPWGTTLVAKGFDANRETVLSVEVSRAQIVHFATHGFLDSEHPELSGIVLTMTDRSGANINGVMPLPDIYGLDLSAELTVLSACQTALGKDVKGEGLIGLTHSFMSAGSKSVVASLWNVDDRATAILMGYFYENMLQKGMTPSAALRSAKLKMIQDKQWNAPYYWAGFVLQGDYTNHITVHRHTWLRPVLVFLFLLILIAAILLIIRQRKQQSPPRQFD
jgi:CHAT domain-containing protein/tetratricopeptide (TPR) repeat protein